MKQPAIALITFLFSLTLSLAHPQLSSQAYVSLLTCSPGDELYEAFGHSALRVFDPVNKIDYTYNYGTFDFEQPGFYSNYAKGRPVFMLSVSHTRHFIGAYALDNRSVFQDILNLTPAQNQKLFELLEENHEPENRNYRYDYIYDNCSTRLRDILEQVLEGKLVFDSFYVSQPYSFRGLMDLYLKEQPWGDLAIDLALGSEIDAEASQYQYMFLPDFLQKGFKNARIVEGENSLPLVKKSTTIFQAETQIIRRSLLTPAVIFWFLFFLFLLKTLLDWRKERISFAADVIFFFITGLAGILLAYISFFSDHHAKGNFNLLWAMPTNFLFALLIPFSNSKAVKYYFLAAAVLAGGVLLSSFLFLPQQMHYAVIPLILIVVIRGWVVFKKKI